MRIQHNIMAMSAYRNYTNNVAAMKKNLVLLLVLILRFWLFG